MAEYVEKPIKDMIGDFYQSHAAGDFEAMEKPLKILQRKIFEGNLDSAPFIDYYNDMFSGRMSFNALVNVKDYPFESIFRELLQNTFDCFYDVPDVKIIVNFKENNEISLSYNEVGFTMEQFLYYLAFGRNKIDKYKEGRFGVGAKSVFMNVQQLSMRSNNFGFKIENKGGALKITDLDLLRELVKGTEITVRVLPEQYTRIKENFMTIADTKGDFINLVELCFAFNRKKVMNPPVADPENKGDAKEELARTFNIAVMEKGKIANLYKIAYSSAKEDEKNRTIRFFQNNKSVVDFICYEEDGFSYLVPFAVAASKRESIVKVFMQKYNFFSTYELTGLINKSGNANESILEEKLSAFFVSVSNEYITMYRTGIKAESEKIVAQKVEQGVRDLISAYSEYFVLAMNPLPGVGTKEEPRYGLSPKSYAFEFIKNFIMTSVLVKDLKTTFQENVSIQFPGEKEPVAYPKLKETAFLQEKKHVSVQDHESGDAYDCYVRDEREKLLASVGSKPDKTLCFVYHWQSEMDADGNVEKSGREFYYEFIRDSGTYIIESKTKAGLLDYNLHFGFNSVAGMTLGKFAGEGSFIQDEDALEYVFTFMDDAFNEDYRVSMRSYQLFVTHELEEHVVDISRIKINNLKNAMETLMNRRYRFATTQAYNDTAKVVLNVFTAGKDTITFLKEIKAQGSQVTLALDINKKYRFSVYGNQFLIPGRITNSQMYDIVGDLEAMIETGMLFGRRFDFPIAQIKYSYDAKMLYRLLHCEDVSIEDIQNIVPRLFISNFGLDKLALLGAGDKFLGIIDIGAAIPEEFDGQVVRMVIMCDDYSKAEVADVIELLLTGENNGLISSALVKNVEPNIILPDQMAYYNRPLPEITKEEFEFLRGEIRGLKETAAANAAAAKVAAANASSNQTGSDFTRNLKPVGNTERSYRNYFAKDVNFKLFGYGGCCPVCDIEVDTINSFAVRDFLVEVLAAVSNEGGEAANAEKEKQFKFSLYMCANDACAADGWVIEHVSIGGMNPFMWLSEITSTATIAPEFLHCSIKLSTRVTHEIPVNGDAPVNPRAFSTPQTSIDFVLSPLLAAKWVEDNIS
ncbi:MAG: hypothetical protein FWD35_00485 [Oscillospiraceae bacterium]|nr:hypothetical protein [Oscillospiraceae bacterium]